MKEREGKVSKEDWRKWQQAAGIKYSGQALLLSNSLLEQKLLAPCAQYCHDWMHGMCSQGVLCTIVSLVVKSLAEDALPNVWHNTLQARKAPEPTGCSHSMPLQGTRKHRLSNAKPLKCSAWYDH